ncbi:MAG: hypothetical protein ACOYMM_03075 [Phycisphaerales bacterium]
MTTMPTTMLITMLITRLMTTLMTTRTRSLLTRPCMRAFALAIASILAVAGTTRAARAQESVTGSVERVAEIAAAKDPQAVERVIAEANAGSIELVVDAAVAAPRVEAKFTVDGKDDKDLKRRMELVKLFAERAADQTVVVQPMFPGKAMPRDSVALRIVVPRGGDSALKIANGSLRAFGTAGKLKLTSKNGAIRVERPAGSVDANATNGAIDIVDAGAEVRASAANGAVTVVLADGNDLPFDVETRNGTARVEVGAGYDGIVTMHSTAGDLDVSDSGKHTRTPKLGDHSKTVEVGAATGNSAIRSTTGDIKLTVRAK